MKNQQEQNLLHENQEKVALSNKRFRVVNCGRRWGKTTLACWEMLGKAVSKNDQRVVYYAPTRDDARDIIWLMLKKIAGGSIVNANESRLELEVRTIDGGTSRILLFGWEAVYQREKGRGVANNFIVLDEVAFYKEFWTHWNNTLSPTLLDTQGEALFLSTPQGFNHFYDLHNMRYEDDEWESFHFTSYDNPYLDPEWIDKRRAKTPEDSFAQEYLGEFRKMQGLVYKEFNRDKHLYDELPNMSFVEKFAGIDFGFTNPTAVLTMYRDKDDNIYLDEEWYERGRTDEQIAEYVAQKQYNKVYPDPASPSSIKVLRDKGVYVSEVVKNADSIKNGIDRIRTLFKMNKLKINKDCKNLISELESYRYPDKKPDKNEEENPIKENDHALDALRYALYTNREYNGLSPADKLRIWNYQKQNKINQAR